MNRCNDWPERLFEFIETRRFMPFEWGVNDCALFSADAVLEITGVDLASDLRKYTTEAGAARLIRKAGGMVGFTRPLREKDTGLAMLGVIVLAEIEGRETFGIALRDGKWCAPGALGLVFRPLSDALKVFEY